VTVKLFIELSFKKLASLVVFKSNTVPDIAVNGLVGGVNVPLYNDVPLTILKFEILPKGVG
jgi:hypothetical protein